MLPEPKPHSATNLRTQNAEDDDDYEIVPRDTRLEDDALDFQSDKVNKEIREIREMASQLIKPISLITAYWPEIIPDFQTLHNAALGADFTLHPPLLCSKCHRRTSASCITFYWPLSLFIMSHNIPSYWDADLLTLLPTTRVARQDDVISTAVCQSLGETNTAASQRIEQKTILPYLQSPQAYIFRRAFMSTDENYFEEALQDVDSEVTYWSPGNEIRLLDLPIEYFSLWSRKKLAMWKDSFGRGKEWRSCRFVKTNKKNQKENFFMRRNWPCKISWKHCPPPVPINMLRRDKSSLLRFLTRPRKVAAPNLRYVVEEMLRAINDTDIDDNG